MSKKFVCIPYSDRMQNPVHICKPKITHHETYIVTEERLYNDKIGRVVPKSKVVKVEKNPLSKFCVLDFSLENLQAIGAPLTPCTMKHDFNTSVNIMEENIDKFNNSNNI